MDKIKNIMEPKFVLNDKFYAKLLIKHNDLDFLILEENNFYEALHLPYRAVNIQEISFTIILEELLNEKRMTKKDLAEQSNVDYTSLLKWFTHGTKPQKRTLKKISSYFNVDEAYLLCEQAEKKKITNENTDYFWWKYSLTEEDYSYNQIEAMKDRFRLKDDMLRYLDGLFGGLGIQLIHQSESYSKPLNEINKIFKTDDARTFRIKINRYDKETVVPSFTEIEYSKIDMFHNFSEHKRSFKVKDNVLEEISIDLLDEASKDYQKLIDASNADNSTKKKIKKEIENYTKEYNSNQ